MLDPSIKEEVKLRNDIVGVISDYVSLRRAGKNYLGLCPFHVEKTPSFTVSPEKQMFYCFGCHASGDVITFVMKRENKSFFEALNTLADRAGIDLPASNLPPEEAARIAKRRELYTALGKASALYANWLGEPEGSDARGYLERRRFSQSTLDRFGIGYSRDSWDALANSLRAEGITTETLVAVGLCIPRNRGSGVYDRFRNRVMIPIRDLHGRTVGFGGRSIDASEPKYLNSPQTEVFNKSKVLFGLNVAREAARREGSVIVVEGYMDAMSLYQAGFENVVASLGTALTQDQARLLMQVSSHVIIAYDADTAGQAATLRGLDVLRQAGASVWVCEMPEGKDPDDIVRDHGKDEFERLLQDAPAVIEYYFKLFRSQHGDSRSGRIRTIESMVPLIAAVESHVEYESYITMVSNQMGISEAAVRAEAQKARTRGRRRARADKSAQSRNTKTNVRDLEETTVSGTRAQAQAEKNILGLMLSHAECRKKCLLELQAGLFSEIGARIFESIAEADKSGSFDVSELLEAADDSIRAELASLAITGTAEGAEQQKVLRDCVVVLKRKRLDELYSEIQSGRAPAGGFEQLFGEYQVLLREFKGMDTPQGPS